MLAMLRLIGFVLGVLLYYMGVRREVTIDNLKNAFPDRSSRWVRRVARRSLGNLGVVFAEMLYLRFASRDSIVDGIIVENLESVKSTISSTNGAILLSGHLGNWEWFALACAVHFRIPLSVIIKNQRSGFAEQFLMSMRTRFGNKMVNAGDVRSIFRALRSGEVLAILGDQTASAESMRVSFFGRNVPTYEGTARLALQTGSPILFLQPSRTKNGYSVRFQVVDRSDLHDTSASSVRTLTERHTAILESTIREQPELWLWQHKRWKHAST